jgi:hypothetical protein
MLCDTLQEINARLSALASCALHICDEGIDDDAMWGLSMLLNKEIGKIEKISEAVGELETGHKEKVDVLFPATEGAGHGQDDDS